jgi:exonuclease VII small subunit
MSEKSSDGIHLSRRQAVAALGAGVLVAGGAAALAATEAANWAKQDAALALQDLELELDALRKQNEQAQLQLSEAQRQLAAANVQLEIYKGLVGLFDTLDQIGLDAIIGAALNAYAGTLAALEAGVDALKAGIVTVENALDNFENTFASIRGALTAAENALANVGALLKNAQELVAQATTPILPFVDGARKFFDDLLGKIPFGAGESARQTLNGIVGLIAGVPAALTEIESGLFRTLREGWFTEDNARTVEATLTKPIINGLLEPLRKFLEQVDAALNGWEAQVAKPVNHALAQRAVVQKQIAEYREQNNV